MQSLVTTKTELRHLKAKLRGTESIISSNRLLLSVVATIIGRKGRRQDDCRLISTHYRLAGNWARFASENDGVMHACGHDFMYRWCLSRCSEVRDEYCGYLPARVKILLAGERKELVARESWRMMLMLIGLRASRWRLKVWRVFRSGPYFAGLVKWQWRAQAIVRNHIYFVISACSFSLIVLLQQIQARYTDANGGDRFCR